MPDLDHTGGDGRAMDTFLKAHLDEVKATLARMADRLQDVFDRMAKLEAQHEVLGQQLRDLKTESSSGINPKYWLLAMAIAGGGGASLGELVRALFPTGGP